VYLHHQVLKLVYFVLLFKKQGSEEAVTAGSGN